MLKKIFIMFITITLLVGICGTVNATELRTTLEVIQQTSETKYLENDQGYISKKIVDSNAETGEATVDISLNNLTNNVEQQERYENTDIYIIVSENIVNDTEELESYISYIETLVTKVFEKSSNTKIGIIGMKGTIRDGELDENGNMIWGENDEGDVKGTSDNAEIVVTLTENIENIKAGLQNMNTSKISYRNNLQAAIKLANNSYSKDVNKLLISLYDGVPSIAIGEKATVTHGTSIFAEYKTIEEAVIGKHEKIATKTRTEILTLKNNDVDFILLRPDDTSYDEKWYNMETGELSLEFDGSSYVKKIYGTLENPTYGKMYSLSNDTLEKVVTEYIYRDIMEDIRVDLESVEIKEYFSEEILENFDITFADESVNTTNLEKDGQVIWNVGNIAKDQTVNLRYTLKIKDMKNQEILNKVLSISDKTELTYINYLDEETSVLITDNPKIRLSEIKEELTATVTYDPTTNTTGKVTATIKTNKRVNEVEGWTISEDGMTLTKVYSTNATETVHLVDIDNMTKDVLVQIGNIIKENPKQPEQLPKDDTTATERLPNAGINVMIIISLIGILISSMIMYKKYNKYKDIK